MKNRGHLSDYFEGIAIKRLSAVEVDPYVSNQHEVDGVASLKKMLGSEKSKFPTKFIYLGEDEDETVIDDGFVTWYDAREQHPSRSEYRLYYTKTSVIEIATEGDLLVIGKIPDESIMFVVVRAGTTFENHIRWLFNLPEEEQPNRFIVREIDPKNDQELDFASRTILSELGIVVTETDDGYLDLMTTRFGEKFPTTRIFSAFARETLQNVSARDNPDQAVIEWMNQEELLFRTLERHLVKGQIEEGFDDVDAFIKYSLSVQNRRKSRVGHALENHVEQAFIDNSVTYSRGSVTEYRSKADFIFPSIGKYRDLGFPNGRLTMLGVKSTCKDRWRQVLSEASRIQMKHLLTLEPGISENQTDEMMANDLQLVIPLGLHSTYKPAQQLWLMSFKKFLELIKTRQK